MYEAGKGIISDTAKVEHLPVRPVQSRGLGEVKSNGNTDACLPVRKVFVCMETAVPIAGSS